MNDATNSPSNTPVNKKQNKALFLRFVLGVVFGIIVITLLLSAFKIISLKSLPFLIPFMQSSKNAKNNPIAIVGAETLFQGDYDYEDQNYPNIKSKTKQFLLDKMVQDSITLQAAAQEKLITLDTTIYNSPSKNYNKRILAVNNVKNIINNQQSTIDGTVVSIWFYNNSKPTPLSVSDPVKAKTLAYSIISPLYQAVKDKKMTITQAGQRIHDDTSLATVDIAYKSNAIYSFHKKSSEQIIFDKTFDAQLKKLQPGQLSELYLAQDINIKTRKMVDAIYIFAQVNSVKTDGTNDDFAAWYEKNKSSFSVKLY